MEIIEIDYESKPICHFCRKNYAEKKYESFHKLYKVAKNEKCDKGNECTCLEIGVKVPSCKRCKRVHQRGIFSISLPSFLILFYFFYTIVFNNNGNLDNATDLLWKLGFSFIFSLLGAVIIFVIANYFIKNVFYPNIRAKSEFDLYHTVNELIKRGWLINKPENSKISKTQLKNLDEMPTDLIERGKVMQEFNPDNK